MTRFFYDTEFLDLGDQLVLISFGIVSEPDPERSLYMVNKDFSWNSEMINRSPSKGWLIEHVKPAFDEDLQQYGCLHGHMKHMLKGFIGSSTPEFWGFHCAHDHVLLCSLFGRMLDTPSKDYWMTYDLRTLMKQQGLHKRDLPAQVGPAHRAIDDAHWIRTGYLDVKARSAITQSSPSRPPDLGCC